MDRRRLGPLEISILLQLKEYKSTTYIGHSKYCPWSELQASKVHNFSRSMISRHFHVQCSAGISQILRNKHGAFLADQQCSLNDPLDWFPFSGMGPLTLKVLHPTLSGQIDKSQTLRPSTPWTFKRSSTTPPCLAIELPSRGAMLHVPRECQVVSTWRWTWYDVRQILRWVIGNVTYSISQYAWCPPHYTEEDL